MTNADVARQRIDAFIHWHTVNPEGQDEDSALMAKDLTLVLAAHAAEVKRLNADVNDWKATARGWMNSCEKAQAREKRLREALEQLECLVDTDNVKTTTDDGEEEYWVNDLMVKHICEAALSNSADHEGV